MTKRYGKGINTTCDDGAIIVEAHGVSKDDEEVAGTLCTNAQGGQRTTDIAGAYVSQAYSIREDNAANTFSATPIDTARCLQKHQPSVQSHHAQTFIAETYPINDGRDIHKDMNGTGIGEDGAPAYTLDRQQHPAVVQTFSVYPEGGNGADIAAAKVECSPALTKVKSERGVHVTETTTAAFMAGQGSRAGGIGYEEEISPTLKAASSGTNQAPTMLQQMSVRRLTPVECERLMGLPDGWTAPPGVKAPDSKRYAACGDAIVTTVAFWIADRIRMIEEEEKA